jgi:amidohydrolase
VTGPAGGPIAATLDDGKQRVAAAVAAHRDEIVDLSHAIHADPEPAFQEVRAAARVADALRRHGFEVEAPAGRLATAIRATLPGGLGTDGPRIGILAEYDALPGLGHGCGHNTMAASGVGAAMALADLAPRLRGEIVFLGTPAEEAGSGKQYMLDDGLFEGLDAALLFHPGDRDHAACMLLACEDVEVTFTGLQAHAASDPWTGRNALDAMILLFTSVGLWRQQLPPDARVHGIITEGGTAANIIPDRAVGHFMIRSTGQAVFESMRQRFREMVTAAGLATGTEAATVFSSGSTVMKDNATLAARFRASMQAAGRVDQGVDPERLGSSDMGNVSLVLPTIHPTLSICDDGVPGHSTLFRDAAATPRADETTLLAATLVAQTAYELFTEPGLVEAAWREFRGI